MARRGHRKSRLGCPECKQRHKKCDESRPICINCKIADIRCSYADQTTFASAAHNSPLTPAIHSTTSDEVNFNAERLTMPDSHMLDPSTSEVNMNHLELLHNLQFHAQYAFMMSDTLSRQYINASIKHGFTYPFLMHEALALSSLHLAIHRADRVDFYRRQSSHLQSLAVQGFHAISLDINHDNCVAVFLFSSMIALYAFCDTFRFRDSDFGSVLDKMTNSFELLRGIRVVMDGWWEVLLQSDIADILTVGQLADRGPVTFTDCQPLRDLIEASDVNDASRKTYEKTIEELQRIFDADKVAGLSQNMTSYVFAWIVTTPSEYASLLRQRRAEALVIMAYYGVLLHRRRQTWPIQDAGAFLIRSIYHYLGSHWTRWLKWPLTSISDSSAAGTPIPEPFFTPPQMI